VRRVRDSYYCETVLRFYTESKPEIINGLLVALQETGLVYRVHVETEKDEENKPISRKTKQIWFAHKEQLTYARHFVSNSTLVINGTFNTNKDRLPLLIAVRVLNSEHIFPIVFSYVLSESEESFTFFQNSMKEECFICEELPPPLPPRVVRGDEADGIISSASKNFL
jgi:hypothetical protein